jgi:sodium-dependent dicarboxylate transporter 2/3/5
VNRLASTVLLTGGITPVVAAAWMATLLVQSTPALTQHPLLLIVALLLVTAPVRLLIPNITGFLALTIPIAMSIGQTAGLNPIICGLVVMIAGDAVLYYPAQSASSLVVYERGHLTAPEIFRFGVWMTLVAYVVVLTVALPYWAMVGEPLRLSPGHDGWRQKHSGSFKRTPVLPAPA